MFRNSHLHDTFAVYRRFEDRNLRLSHIIAVESDSLAKNREEQSGVAISG
jgi:hypothetical protein